MFLHILLIFSTLRKQRWKFNLMKIKIELSKPEPQVSLPFPCPHRDTCPSRILKIGNLT